jgi:predicted CoA-binding protein
MATLNEAAQDFLAQPRIAVAGVSRGGVATANGIYKVLKEKGYQVFAINPNAETVEGDKCYATVKDIPGGVDGLVIATRPELTAQIVRDCPQAGVKRVWMHNNTLGPTSVSDEAVEFCKQHHITVIAGACPMMYIDPFHKVMRGMLGIMGRLPQPQ